MSTGLVFTPSIIVALVVLLVFAIFTIGTVVVLTYRRYSRTTRKTDSGDLEADLDTTKVNDGAKEASLWSRIKDWYWPDEPELPWPVYAVLPHLRPKGPLHRRVFRAMVFWRKDEVKREPFTVADVLRAMEEIEAKEQAMNTAAVVDVDHACPRD